jgi:N6-adenosine-specific RNA methylase IME4
MTTVTLHPEHRCSAKAVRVSDIVIAPNRMRALRPEKVAEIAESIQTQGLLQPIVVRPRGRGSFWLVAGRHRLEAVRELDLDRISAVVLDGLDADAALLAEIDENLVRADLSPAERALHVGRRKELYEKIHPDTVSVRKRGGPGRGKRNESRAATSFIDDAAAKMGKHRATIARDAARATKIAGLADVIGTSLDEGEELDALAKLPESAQADLIARAKAGGRVTARHTAKLLRRKEREVELADATAAASEALGQKLYGVIYLDPPWRYENPPVGDVARANENHYGTMPLDEIKALKIPAGPDVAVFMWATIPLLDVQMEVLAAWGLKYKSAIAWEKDREGTGYWIRGQVELLLIATRGEVPAPAPGEQLPAIVRTPRGRHSEKPDCFAEMIANLFPNVPKLEMFARKTRPGWDVWGNEIPPPQEAQRESWCEMWARPFDFSKLKDHGNGAPDEGMPGIPPFLRRTAP